MILAELAGHCRLRSVVPRPKGDVVNRSRPLARREEFSGGPQVDDSAKVHARRPKALRRALAAVGDEAEHVGQNSGGWGGFSQEEAHAVKAADGVFRGRPARAPARFRLEALDAGQREPGPVRVLERKRRFAEPLGGRIMDDALLDQALGSEADRAFRDTEDSLLRFPDPEPACW